GELEVPAYVAMQRPGPLADRMLEILLAGVSTRRYGEVIPEMADTVGVSKSAVSRETIEASERVLRELMERRLDAWDLLVVYLDGIHRAVPRAGGRRRGHRRGEARAGCAGGFE